MLSKHSIKVLRVFSSDLFIHCLKFEIRENEVFWANLPLFSHLQFSPIPPLPSSLPTSRALCFELTWSTEWSMLVGTQLCEHLLEQGVRSLKRTDSPSRLQLHCQLPIASCSVKGWDFISPSPTYVGILAGFILDKSGICSHSSCVVMCVEALSCLVNTITLRMPRTYDSYRIPFPSSKLIPEPWEH